MPKYLVEILSQASQANTMNFILPPRRLILLKGSQTWGKHTAQAFIQASSLDSRPINNEHVFWCDNQSSAQLLGQDKAFVVVNAYLGISPDEIGQTSGTIMAGGALIIICPDFTQWPDLLTLNQTPPNKNYIQRWIRLIESALALALALKSGIEVYEQDNNPHIKPVSAQGLKHINTTQDQHAAIKALIKSATGKRRRPAVITADRGRGKSAALGMAAAQLIHNQQAQNILVTSAGFKQVLNLFKHAQQSLPSSQFDAQQKCISHAHGKIQYLAPDKLIKHTVECDLLLVDEAAMLGLPRLKALLTHYPRIAFSTTLHGYEGSGRGFALKFQTSIKTLCRGQYTVNLEQPIRFRENDPLENWTNRLLLLKPSHSLSTGAKTECVDGLDFKALAFSIIPQANLAHNEALLQETFQLLVHAHYQTRPADLSYLLDAPNAQLCLTRYHGKIIGLVWLMFEGELSNTLAQDIVTGKRRPQGHLVPQILAAHLGLSTAATLHCARIQRIVVAPKYQRLGIGKWMLAQLEATSKSDYLASSFAADKPLAAFWRNIGYQTVRISDKQNAASGMHSAVVLKPISAPAKAMLASANIVFEHQLRQQLSRGLSMLSPALLRALIHRQTPHPSLAVHAQQAIVLFAYAKRPYESSLSSLHTLAEAALLLGNAQDTILIMRVLQNRSWSDCAQSLGLSGKAQCIALLRSRSQTLLKKILSDAEHQAIFEKYNI